MMATGVSGVNVWKELATEREKNARVMTLLSVALGFALLATVSYSYASAAKFSGLCGQIETIRAAGGSSLHAITDLAANYCS